MNRPKKRKPKAPVQRSAKAAPSSFVLALHDARSAEDQTILAASLRSAAERLRTGAALSLNPSDKAAWHFPSGVVADPSLLLFPRGTFVDTSLTVEQVLADRKAIAARYDAIARCMVNPPLGFRPSIPKTDVDAIAAGFAKVESSSNLILSYVRAALGADEDEESYNLDIWMPTPEHPVSVHITMAGQSGLGYSSILGTQSIPPAILRNLIAPVTPDVWMASMERDKVTVSRLMMQHQDVVAADPLDVIRIVRDPRFANMPVTIRYDANRDLEEDDVVRRNYSLFRQMLA